MLARFIAASLWPDSQGSAVRIVQADKTQPLLGISCTAR